MLKYIFSLIAWSTLFLGYSQTDSTDLELYMTDAVIEDGLDSILYLGEPFQELNLDFTVSDTVTFNKVHIEIINTEGALVVFRKSYLLTDLEEDELIEDWDVTIPFGNLLNTNSYQVAIIVEQYDGSLGSVITKIIEP